MKLKVNHSHELSLAYCNTCTLIFWISILWFLCDMSPHEKMSPITSFQIVYIKEPHPLIVWANRYNKKISHYNITILMLL